MQVERLRLVGFKSFVDATELAIEPGLTGIVGPNGCGKSNLVEALRWVMGETSARRLRGGEMDDVIFGGTSGRPARNIAEVALVLGNDAGAAGFPFDDRDEIEVVRRIERGSGSAYRLNGREVRARDVQLLFADASTGPHSGALVSQGRIGALIAAKPSERRVLLDEAAGTAGLHARRHEADLKLRAAEDNLLRLDDVIVTMATQLEALKKQARQAQRYRRVAEQVRRTQALLLYLRWLAAERESAAAAASLREAERTVAETTAEASRAARERDAADVALPPLRLAEAGEAAKLQRLTHAREALEQELKRVLSARTDGERRAAQIAADLAREEEHLHDSAAALSRLSDERETLAVADAADGPARTEAAGQRETIAAQLVAAEAALQQATEACAAGDARRAAMERQRGDVVDRRARVQVRLADGERQRAALSQAIVPAATREQAAATRAEAERLASSARRAIDDGVQRTQAAQERESRTADAARELERRLARLAAEADGLETVLVASVGAKGKGASDGAPVLAAIRVEEGFEAAIGALFDDELSAPVIQPGASAARGWVALGPKGDAPSLPPGAVPLAASVGVPDVLDRRLAYAGRVDDEETGWRLQPTLTAGQVLVDRAGHLWRWDGFTRGPAGTSLAAQHLRHRNRLAALRRDLAAEMPALRVAQDGAAAAQRERQQAVEADRISQAALREAETTLSRARAAEADLARRALDAESRLAAMVETIDKLTREIEEAETQRVELENSLASLPDPGMARAALETARADAAGLRSREAEIRAAIDRFQRDADNRTRRLESLTFEERSWRKRGDGATVQRQSLAERHRQLSVENAALAARPAAIAADSEALARDSAAATDSRRRAADALAICESRLRQTGDAARRADQALAEAREARARFEVLRDGAIEALAQLRRDVRERVDAVPERLAELADLSPDSPLPGAVETSSRLDRLSRERDAMGPVNLVAETEAAEVETRMATLGNERGELTEAIARLRRGIAAIDDEGRKRLLAAFTVLDEHFRALFVRLFGGGEAHLALEENADPLAAGLEIMASPPGKRLQALSLLSGGEQALTATALLFAVFLTNPSPVCVLDEVDAPLDDANVDRFCSLVGETAETTGTRFLVITHHRVTMARMDRLFGVTMRERGVSQLVSVDLGRAAQLRRTA